MSLNIKNVETCRLAGELAHLTGETKTGAITVALKERLERERRKRSVEARVRELARYRAALCPPASRRALRQRTRRSPVR